MFWVLCFVLLLLPLCTLVQYFILFFLEKPDPLPFLVSNSNNSNINIIRGRCLSFFSLSRTENIISQKCVLSLAKDARWWETIEIVFHYQSKDGLSSFSLRRCKNCFKARTLWLGGKMAKRALQTYLLVLQSTFLEA